MIEGTSAPEPPPPTVVIVSNHLAQPRHGRRVEALEQLGFEVLLAGYDRGIYGDSGLLGSREVLLVRKMRAGRYHRRLLRLQIDARELHRRVRETGRSITLIWTFGLDCYLVGAGLARRLRADRRDDPRLVLEIGDLRGRGEGASLSRGINLLLEKQAAKAVDGIVVTAPAHQTAFARFKRHPPIHVHLNRMSPEGCGARPQLGQPPKEPFRLGVIGFFRYSRVLERLVEAARRLRPRWEVHFIGDGPEEILSRVRAWSEEEGVVYHGAYRSPRDLPDVYGKVDVIWSVYDVTDGNVTTAIPNKLFESQWYGAPIIVAEGTALADVATEMEAGVFTVDSQSVEAYVALLDGLSVEALSAARAAALSVPTSMLVDNAELLRPFLDEILKGELDSGNDKPQRWRGGAR